MSEEYEKGYNAGKEQVFTWLKQALYDFGGTGATDDWSKGWDAAIDAVESAFPELESLE